MRSCSALQTQLAFKVCPEEDFSAGKPFTEILQNMTRI
jgi:hypothetical protein